jgi:hypothetical protein
MALVQCMQGVKMAEIKWENGGSLDADVFLGADLLYDPGSYLCIPMLLLHLRSASLCDVLKLICDRVTCSAGATDWIVASKRRFC